MNKQHTETKQQFERVEKKVDLLDSLVMSNLTKLQEQIKASTELETYKNKDGVYVLSKVLAL